MAFQQDTVLEVNTICVVTFLLVGQGLQALYTHMLWSWQQGSAQSLGLPDE